MKKNNKSLAALLVEYGKACDRLAFLDTPAGREYIEQKAEKIFPRAERERVANDIINKFFAEDGGFKNA